MITKETQIDHLRQRTGWKIECSGDGFYYALTPLGWASGRDKEEIEAEFRLLVGKRIKELANGTLVTEFRSNHDYSCETCGAECDEPSVICNGCSEGNY